MPGRRMRLQKAQGHEISNSYELMSLIEFRHCSEDSPPLFALDLPIFVIDCTGPGTFHDFSEAGNSAGFPFLMKPTVLQ